ncbi:hypothetical protein TCAL_13217 [Tigriopus californicus]|uniref:IGFBP N-terminal domain-containing protein n=1 Tax=Tigriopus californicus TaxID=6832 RepID=A0A553P8Q5_TIGCA|nr:cysteine-rich motor neuron 1 protein-like [Tigriopus californicus]TRY74047.1 hypothetical protein TCAL_13217 [Tigriopus californicus]|eukprot:TCALIF_13217-PA protein Name:"Similar to Crim1 Cysteine-rich motor neuron 1 protein (Mus musculus)" AED:0.03 eAED:0.03 QI:129/1/1/1/1/1/3/24/292
MKQNLPLSAVVLLGICIGSQLFPPSQALSCLPCQESPCETPACCESGSYIPGVCGCCQICAKAESSVCGGPWRTSGVCNEGLFCHRECDCKTVEDQHCVFPFKFKGQVFDACTDFESTNDKLWCATEVNDLDEVIEGQWADCKEGCPGMPFECDDTQLFNMEGICVNQTERARLEAGTNVRAPKTPQQFDDGAQNATVAPYCSPPKPGTTLPVEETCQCAKGEECRPSNSNGDDSVNFELKTWCFLSYVADPSNPTQDCFPEVQWSKSAGRFWSNKACETEAEESILFIPSL